jgi:hypothetical protein
MSPGVAGTWVNGVGEAVLPLINLMHEALLSESFVQMDETYLQVVRSEKAPASDHYMVVRAAGPPCRRIILFNYEPSRTVAALQDLLIGPQGPYTGKLLTDGLELYDTVAEALKLVHFGCLPTLPHVLSQGGEGDGAALWKEPRAHGDRSVHRQSLRGRAADQGDARGAGKVRYDTAPGNGAQDPPGAVRPGDGGAQGVGRETATGRTAHKRTRQSVILHAEPMGKAGSVPRSR